MAKTKGVLFFSTYFYILFNILYIKLISWISQLEATVVQMQDPSTGVKGTDQKLNVTIIPHVITGEFIIKWRSYRILTLFTEHHAFYTVRSLLVYIQTQALCCYNLTALAIYSSLQLDEIFSTLGSKVAL